MKLIDQWKDYVGPTDERIEAEANRIYKRGFIMLMFGFLAILYYDTLVRQVAAMASLDATGSATMEFDFFGIALFAWMIITCSVCIALQCKGGYVERNRFAEVDAYPGGYFALVSGIVAAAAGLVVVLMRVLAEIQVFGLGAVTIDTWLMAGVLGISLALMAFALQMIGFYLVFRAAKRNRKKLEAQFGE